MSKITKKQLQHSVDLLNKENSSQHDYLMRIKRALKSIDIDILSDEFDEPKPQLKQLDQSVFKEWADCWKFFAIDEDGDAWRYREKPYIDDGDKRWSSSNTIPLLVGKGYDASNWQNSLIERDIAKELTGSDLARAMLARGDKYVMCLVFDDTRNLDTTYVIRGYYDGYFHTKLNSWENAVPISNQGEPLTSSEVGL